MNSSFKGPMTGTPHRAGGKAPQFIDTNFGKAPRDYTDAELLAIIASGQPDADEEEERSAQEDS